MKESILVFGNAFLLGLGAAAVFATPVFRALVRLKSQQNVSAYAPDTHQAKQGTPTMGGLMTVLGAVVALVAVGEGGRPGWVALWIVGFALIGFADDFVVPRLMAGKRGLGWKQKFGAQVVAASLAVPLLGWDWSAANVGLAVVIVLFFSNAYNFSDGLDALAGSLGVILACGFGAIAILSGVGPLVAVCGALAGALLPFLLLNAPPAKVFMGDVGSLAIGAAFGLVACDLVFPRGLEHRMDVWTVPGVVLLSLVMAAELIPVPLQVASVKLTGRRLFPFTPIHHAFEKAGWRETRVTFAFAVVQFALAVGAVALSARLCP